jgi:ferredoxin-NADP reductase
MARAAVLGRLTWLAGWQCFICGPTGFVESAARLLVEQGIADRQIRTERFGPSGGTP